MNREYYIKAAFLYHFANFVEWPAEAFSPDSETLTVGVIGKSPFGAALGSIEGKTVKGRQLVIRQFNSVEELQHCHILFVSPSQRQNWPQIVNAVQGWHVLTVSEVDGFAHNGGVINFRTRGNKVRFEINREAAELAGLRISARLLRIAILVSLWDDDVIQANRSSLLPTTR